MDNRLSIIVYSCKKNSRMWPVFLKLFRKYWNNCQYKLILVTDFHAKGEEGFDQIIAIDDTWGKMIKQAIQEADTKYVSLWMDDYLLCDYVDNNVISEKIDVAIRYKAINFRLVEAPKAYGGYCESNIGYYRLGDAYSLSTQVGIWDSKFLLDFIPDLWSAWDFERIGSMSRIKLEQPILVCLDYTFPYIEGVRNGKWMMQGYDLCKRNGIDVTETGKKVMSNIEMAKIYFKSAIIDINPNLVQRIQNFLLFRQIK